MQHSDSLLEDLLQSQPGLKTQIYFKATLTAISHAMEDLILAGTDRPLVIANFQQERFYRQEARRYQKIAQYAEQVYVLAAPETDFLTTAPYPTIALSSTDALSQEWHLVILGRHLCTCLIAREHAAPVHTIALDSARQFRGFWTFDPQITRQAAQRLLQRIGGYAPAFSNQLAQVAEKYDLQNTQASVSIFARPSDVILGAGSQPEPDSLSDRQPISETTEPAATSRLDRPAITTPKSSDLISPESTQKLSEDSTTPSTIPSITPSTLSTPQLNNRFNPQSFVDRLVTYLQASQYKQIRAYQRVAAQEQQERLVNTVTTEIRRSLYPEAVLSATVQEIGNLFKECRCLLSQIAVSSLPYPQSTIEHEDTPATLPRLQSGDWLLAAHAQWQSRLSRGQLVAISDTAQDPTVQSHPDLQQTLEQAQIKACLMVPIVVQRRQLAVLELHHPQPHPWSVSDQALLSAIATQVGTALLQSEAYVNVNQLNQQLVAVKQSQNNLVAIVGHELRTPLSTIQVCLESLASEPEMPLKFRQTMVETAIADSERLNKLVQDFLLLSRLESDLTSWQVEPVDLADVIALALNQIRTAARSRSLPTITVDVPNSLPFAEADGEALLQLLIKLLDNACKFTPPTGAVTLRVRDLYQAITAPSPGQESFQPLLEVQISDTGSGIEPSQLETIFERFHQEEGFLQRAVGGTGLGLAICRQLVRRLGGQIRATSQGKGQGSQFYVTLPALAT